MDGRDDASDPSWWSAPDAPPPPLPPAPPPTPPSAFAGDVAAAGGPQPPPLPPAPGYGPPQHFGHPGADPFADPFAAPFADPSGPAGYFPPAGPPNPAGFSPPAGQPGPFAYPPGAPGGPGRPEVLQLGAPPGPPRGRGRVVGLVVGALVVALLVTVGGVFLARRYLDGQVTAANWREPVTAYCRRMDGELKAAARSAGDDEVARLKQVGSVLRTMNSHLRDMKVVQQQRSDYDAMLDRWDEVPKAYDAAVKAAGQQDTAAAGAALTRADQANDQGNAIANRIGLPVCAGAGGLPDGGGSAPASPPSPTAVV